MYHPKLMLYYWVFIGYCCFYASPSIAFGKTGHQLICQLAFDHLSPAKQEQVNLLLSQLSKQQALEINRFNRHKKHEKITFADSCTWADAIKKQQGFSQFNAWHYINVERNHLDVSASSCQKDCITQAIIFHQQQLQNSSSTAEKITALLFLSHWLGDIHQPLHVSFASDFGGNRNKIKYRQFKCNNLHWLWDECLLYPITGNAKGKKHFQQLYRQLNDQWQTAPISQWQQGNVYQWATESLMLSRNQSLKYCQLDKNVTCTSLSTKTITLSDSYYSRFSPLLKQQILRAGARLAHLLEQFL